MFITADCVLFLIKLRWPTEQKFLYLSSGGLETDKTGENRKYNHEYRLLIRLFLGARTTFWSRNTKNNLLNSRFTKNKNR